MREHFVFCGGLIATPNKSAILHLDAPNEIAARTMTLRAVHAIESGPVGDVGRHVRRVILIDLARRLPGRSEHKRCKERDCRQMLSGTSSVETHVAYSHCHISA